MKIKIKLKLNSGLKEKTFKALKKSSGKIKFFEMML